jgi:hypothetical protein
MTLSFVLASYGSQQASQWLPLDIGQMSNRLSHPVIHADGSFTSADSTDQRNTF